MENNDLYYVDFEEFDNATAIPDGDKIIHKWEDSFILLDDMRKDNGLIPHALHLVSTMGTHFYSDDERQYMAYRGSNSYKGTINNKIKEQVLKAYSAFRRKNKEDDFIMRYTNNVLSIPSFSLKKIVEC